VSRKNHCVFCEREFKGTAVKTERKQAKHLRGQVTRCDEFSPEPLLE